jgi:mannose-6-phosphate isomerase-like protein (cupin superfamily)
MKLTFLIGLLLSLPLSGQTAGKAEVFSAKEIQSQLGSLSLQAKSAGSGSAMIGKYGSHNIMLSARTTSGGGEVHQHFDDVMIVIEGTATLITGGTLVEPHAESDGELRGTSIKDGQSQTISTGDVVHVPAGTPHQLVVAPGTHYSAMVVKVKE